MRKAQGLQRGFPKLKVITGISLIAEFTGGGNSSHGKARPCSPLSNHAKAIQYFKFLEYSIQADQPKASLVYVGS